MKTGFVNIFGRPNAGKSTLLNALMGEKLAIVSPKVQTTRHRIKAIMTEKDYQVIFSDTPGIIEPRYKLHEKMMQAVKGALEDADETTNVIPNEVKLKGTFRAMDETWRFKAHELIRKMATDLVQGMGGEIDLLIDVGYPSVYNNEALNEITKEKAAAFIGEANVEETEKRMGAEDFGYYSQQIPGCFFRLGVMNREKGIISGVHTPTFNIDESAIEIGMGMMAWLGSSIKS